MMTPMQEDKLDKLLELVEKTIIEKEKDKQYRELHTEEHRFLRTLIAAQEAKIEMRREILKKVIAGGVWGVMIAVMASLGFTAKAWVLGKFIPT